MTPQPNDSTVPNAPVGAFAIRVPTLQIDPNDLIVVACTSSNNLTNASYTSDTCCTCKE
jgi:hypothetical protein